MDTDRLRSRYYGERASGYENRRQNLKKWHREEEAVTSYLERISTDPDGVQVLDVPVGTGRFFDYYDQNSPLDIIGVDASADMLKEAREKLDGLERDISLRVGDIFELNSLEINPDVIVCLRFLNWVNFPDFRRAIGSIASINPVHVIADIRVRTNTKHRLAGLIRRAYHAGFTGAEDKTVIHDMDSVQSAFAHCGYAIADRTLVDEWTFGDKYVYLLSADRA